MPPAINRSDNQTITKKKKELNTKYNVFHCNIILNDSHNIKQCIISTFTINYM